MTVGWIELTSDIAVIDYERKGYLDAAYLNVGLVEVYDPTTKKFTELDIKEAEGSDSYRPEYGDSVVPLKDGTVLIKGGFIYYPPDP